VHRSSDYLLKLGWPYPTALLTGRNDANALEHPTIRSRVHRRLGDSIQDKGSYDKSNANGEVDKKMAMQPKTSMPVPAMKMAHVAKRVLTPIKEFAKDREQELERLGQALAPSVQRQMLPPCLANPGVVITTDTAS